MQGHPVTIVVHNGVAQVGKCGRLIHGFQVNFYSYMFGLETPLHIFSSVLTVPAEAALIRGVVPIV